MRLVEYLFDRQGYNPLIRPVRNLTETVTVAFGLAMIQLINVVCNILILIKDILHGYNYDTGFHFKVYSILLGYVNYNTQVDNT